MGNRWNFRVTRAKLPGRMPRYSITFPKKAYSLDQSGHPLSLTGSSGLEVRYDRVQVRNVAQAHHRTTHYATRSRGEVARTLCYPLTKYSDGIRTRVSERIHVT